MQIKKERINLVIDSTILNEFRRKFIRKKGDFSSKIEKMMLKEVKR